MLERKSGQAIASLLLLSAALLLVPRQAAGQLPSNLASANLTAVLAESLTVDVTGGSTVDFALLPAGVADGSPAVTIRTSWVLNPSRGAASLYGYFDTPTAALTDGGAPANDIPSANVFGMVTTGEPTSYTAFTQGIPVGPGSGLRLFTEEIKGGNKNKTRTDSLNLQINLTTLDQLPAGTYTGILKIQARAL